MDISYSTNTVVQYLYKSPENGEEGSDNELELGIGS